MPELPTPVLAEAIEATVPKKLRMRKPKSYYAIYGSTSQGANHHFWVVDYGTNYSQMSKVCRYLNLKAVEGGWHFDQLSGDEGTNEAWRQADRKYRESPRELGSQLFRNGIHYRMSQFRRGTAVLPEGDGMQALEQATLLWRRDNWGDE